MRALASLGLGLVLAGAGLEARGSPPPAAMPAVPGAEVAWQAPGESEAEDPPAGCTARRRPSRTVLDGKANLNTASVELLQRLPGVGRSSAERILERRARRPFQRIEELVRVKGFGRKRFQRIRPYLSVEGPSTLRPVWVLPREEVLAQREGRASK